jgi:predicted SPOUT superfamily RNA methylase MTH1
MIGKNLTIAIPASIITDTPHLREKTAKIGLVGRAAAIFRVNRIIIYPDKSKITQSKEIDLITTLLTYINTPQYLRKNLFGLDAKLKYAGILPPLRTPNHPLNSKSKKLMVGEYREGVIIGKQKEGMLVEIGVEKTALLRDRQWSVGDHIITQIIKMGKQIEVQNLTREEVPSYWGFSVEERSSFGSIARNNEFDLIIATSKKGRRLSNSFDEIMERWKNADKIILEFGAPNRGLFEIAKNEGINLRENTDFVVNIAPKQGTATIRTEEALLAALSIFNLYMSY